MPPGDELFARQLFVSGDMLRRQQRRQSRGEVAWYIDLILANGGPNAVMCTTPLPIAGHHVELCMPVSVAQMLGAKYENMALVRLAPDPLNPNGIEMKPLIDYVTDEAAAASRVAAMPPIPDAVMNRVRAMLGMPPGDALHPDNQ